MYLNTIPEPQFNKDIKTLGPQELSKADVKVKNQDILKSAKAFEGLFVSMMLKEMRKTVPKSTLMSGGPAEEMFRDMLDNTYAEKMVSHQGFGLAEAMYRQMKIGVTD